MRENLNQYKEESARENLENVNVTYQQKHTDDIAASEHIGKLAEASLEKKVDVGEGK